MKLPEDKCLPSPYMNKSKCGEHEWDCGDGQCIQGLGICDNQYHCLNGADEMTWSVLYMYPSLLIMLF